MTKNDTFFKILFAVEVALLPMIFLPENLLPKWSMGLFIAGILLAKIWLELFKDRYSKTHAIIDGVGSIAVFTTILVYFINTGVLADNITKPLAIAVISLVIAFNILNVLLFDQKMPEFVEAVDFCYMLSECLALGAFVLAKYYLLITKIALFAILLTMIVSVAFKLYFIARNAKTIMKINHKK